MAIKSFNKVDSPDRIVSRIQDNVEAVFKQLLLNPVLSSNIIRNVPLLAVSTSIVNTGLSEKANGWIIIRKSSDSTVWEVASDDYRVLHLQCSADTTVDIMVF